MCARFPDAVLGGELAARLSYWPGLRPSDLLVYRPSREQGTPYRFTQHHVPAAWVMTRSFRVCPTRVVRVRMTDPALTALDLAVATEGDSIDQALRTRSTTLERMHEALAATPNRAGRAEVRRLLRDSRDQPWSALERRAHVLLRSARISGWRANRWISCGEGGYCGDVVFPGVVVELDGWAFHSSHEAFEADRLRQNALIEAGWIVLRYTHTMLTADPSGFIRQVTSVTRARSRMSVGRDGALGP